MQAFKKLNESALLGFDRRGHAMWDICLPGEGDGWSTSDSAADPVGETKPDVLSIAVGTGKIKG